MINMLKKKKNVNWFLKLSFPVVLSAMMLVACAEGPGNNESEPDVSREVPSEAETGASPSGKVEADVTPVPGHADPLKKIDTKAVAGRVLKRFGNQCLEWYYSDSILLGQTLNGHETELSFRPGDTVYYRILTNKNGTIYQVVCGTDEALQTSFSMNYVYYPKLDQIVSADLKNAQEQEVLSGSFVLSDKLSQQDEKKAAAIKEQFSLFWKKWLAEKATADMTEVLKNAYLMPFVIEDDGTASLCIFLEQEGGTWLMARSVADFSYVIPESETEADPDLGDTLFGNYTIMSNTLWNNTSENKLIVRIPDDMDLKFERVYIPYTSGYTLLAQNADAYGAMDNELRQNIVSFRSVEGYEFIKSVPEMAVEKL
ncbi:MAG: hypothetical protein J5825_09810 [Lachnospiraceae bacterium]|nr:hypothetical protein [Lachnospiraceae bacterium]